MVSRVLSLCTALILAIGIAGLPVLAKTKKPAPAKKTTAKKDTKKSSKKNSPDTSSRSSKKAKKDDARSAKSRSRKVSKKDNQSAKRTTKPKSSSKRSKNEDEEKYAPSRSSKRDSQTVVAASSPVVRPTTVIAGGGATYVESDDAEGVMSPKPANRIVSDISPARVVQIQNALIKEGLMTGPANGVYDQATFSAMSSFQSRKGYKPLGVPTADSLKALGVPKNSGRTYMSASRVLESTAPRMED